MSEAWWTKERKFVSVLVCGLRETDELADRLSPEAFDALMHEFFAHARHVLDSHGGTLAQRLSDGFVALFGAPIAC